jgi:hypothetical protein
MLLGLMFSVDDDESCTVYFTGTNENGYIQFHIGHISFALMKENMIIDMFNGSTNNFHFAQSTDFEGMVMVITRTSVLSPL